MRRMRRGKDKPSLVGISDEGERQRLERHLFAITILGALGAAIGAVYLVFSIGEALIANSGRI